MKTTQKSAQIHVSLEKSREWSVFLRSFKEQREIKKRNEAEHKQQM